MFMASAGKMFATHPPLANSGPPCFPGSTTWSSSRHTARHSTGAYSEPVAPCMEFVCHDCRSPVRSSWRVHSGASTRHVCRMSAAGSVSHCATTIQGPMRKHARVLCLRRRLRDGKGGDRSRLRVCAVVRGQGLREECDPFTVLCGLVNGNLSPRVFCDADSRLMSQPRTRHCATTSQTSLAPGRHP